MKRLLSWFSKQTEIHETAQAAVVRSYDELVKTLADAEISGTEPPDDASAAKILKAAGKTPAELQAAVDAVVEDNALRQAAAQQKAAHSRWREAGKAVTDRAAKYDAERGELDRAYVDDINRLVAERDAAQAAYEAALRASRELDDQSRLSADERICRKKITELGRRRVELENRRVAQNLPAAAATTFEEEQDVLRLDELRKELAKELPDHVGRKKRTAFMNLKPRVEKLRQTHDLMEQIADLDQQIAGVKSQLDQAIANRTIPKFAPAAQSIDTAELPDEPGDVPEWPENRRRRQKLQPA